MEENIHVGVIDEKVDDHRENIEGHKQIAGAILLAGILIAGAILLQGKNNTSTNTNIATPPTNSLAGSQLEPISSTDHILGNTLAKVAVIEYGDFQCPFCQKFYQTVEYSILNNYVLSKGNVQFVYRDYPFLGPESKKAALAARCAGDQNKFWEYHNYLFEHQNGENRGAFSDINLKSFAKILSLNTSVFNQCFDSGKYTSAVLDSQSGGSRAGVNGTPKGFILRDGKVVDTIDGLEDTGTVEAKIDKALK